LRKRRFCSLAAACAAVFALAGCGGSSSPSVPRRSTPLVSMFEADAQLLSDPAVTLDTLRSLGVDVVKVFVPWAGLAPDPSASTPPAGFDGADPAAYPASGWAPFDAIVRNAAARGIGVDLTLAEPPLWAATPGSPNGPHPQWEPSARDFGAFVRAVGTRYSGHYTPPGQDSPLPRVGFWSIWNEPNYGQDLAPQATDHTLVEVSPRLYRGLVDAAWAALHATGHGGDTILIGELAPRGQSGGSHPGNYDGMMPLRFVRALYCLGRTLEPLRGQAATLRGCPPTAAGSAKFRADNPALFEASGFADHPYPQGQVQPDVVTPDEPDYADFAAFPKLISTLDRAQRVYGSRTRFPIWSTEFGYKTDPPLALQASPSVAAGLINWSEYLSWRDPRVASYDQYLLVDPPPSSGSSFVTGLEFADGRPKAVYSAYRMPLWLPVTSFSRGHAIEVWGCVRPARFARLETGVVQRVRVQFARAGVATFATVATVSLTSPYGYFDVRERFPGTGSVRLAWRYPHGAEIFSRTVAVTAR
jgi:hypothetical protein